MDLKYHLRRGVMSLNYFMDYILMDMLDIEDYFKYIFKNYETATDNPIRVYVHKKWNKIIFRTKTGYYLELLTPETMKLFWSTKSKITKNKTSHLGITEVVLVHRNIVNNDSRVLYTIVSNKSFGQFLDISPTNLIF